MVAEHRTATATVTVTNTGTSTFSSSRTNSGTVTKFWTFVGSGTSTYVLQVTDTGTSEVYVGHVAARTPKSPKAISPDPDRGPSAGSRPIDHRDCSQGIRPVK
jgi:hypothetical protein